MSSSQPGQKRLRTASLQDAGAAKRGIWTAPVLAKTFFGRSVKGLAEGWLRTAKGEEKIKSKSADAYARVKSVSLGFIILQTNRMGDVIELLPTDFFEALAGRGKLFIDLNDFLGHGFVSFLSAADKQEIGTRSQPFMTIGIQAQTEHN